MASFTASEVLQGLAKICLPAWLVYVCMCARGTRGSLTPPGSLGALSRGRTGAKPGRELLPIGGNFSRSARLENPGVCPGWRGLVPVRQPGEPGDPGVTAIARNDYYIQGSLRGLGLRSLISALVNTRPPRILPAPCTCSACTMHYHVLFIFR